MFVYVNEKDASLNVEFANNSAKTPSIVSLQGFKNGAKVLVNAETVVDLENAEKFDTIRRPFVYQLNNKLNVTFQDNIPVETPEVTIDEISDDEIELVANGTTVRITYTKDGAEVVTESEPIPDPEPTPTPIPEPTPNPDPDPEPEVNETPDEDDEPVEEVTEE